MPTQQPKPSPPLKRGDLERAFSTTIGYWGELFQRSLTITNESWQRVAQRLFDGLLGSRAIDDLVRDLAIDWRNTIYELITAWPIAAENAVEKLALPLLSSLDEPSRPIEGMAPVQHGRSCDIDTAEGQRALAMPARIIDASEACALWFAALKDVTGAMSEQAQCLQPEDFGQRTIIGVLALDHRTGDLGRFIEMALTACVRLKDDPSSPLGVGFIATALSSQYAADAASQLVGIDATVVPSMDVTYAEETVTFMLDKDNPNALSMTLPRFGAGRAVCSMPFGMYGAQRDQQTGSLAAVAANFRRRARGEGFAVGATVHFTLPPASAPCCLTKGDPPTGCLCRQIRAFRLAERLPALNGWAEWLRGDFEPPNLFDFSGPRRPLRLTI